MRDVALTPAAFNDNISSRWHGISFSCVRVLESDGGDLRKLGAVARQKIKAYGAYGTATVTGSGATAAERQGVQHSAARRRNDNVRHCGHISDH